MPRWINCFIDKRALSNEGQWGIYKCEYCGKLFNARMCQKKKVKHVFCSTKCKKESQVKFNRLKIDNKIYNSYYNKFYNQVRIEAFKLCQNTLDRQDIEDMQQYGFLELWYIYNRNKFNCSNNYIKKAIRNSIISNYKWVWKKRGNTLHYDSIEDLDRWEILSQKTE